MTLSEVLEAITPLIERIGSLERRLAAIEARAVIEYHGVWEPGRTYARGAAVTCSGGLWVTSADTDQRPGDGSTTWKLAVKSGSVAGNGAAAPVRQGPTQPRGNGFNAPRRPRQY